MVGRSSEPTFGQGKTRQRLGKGSIGSLAMRKAWMCREGVGWLVDGSGESGTTTQGWP